MPQDSLTDREYEVLLAYAHLGHRGLVAARLQVHPTTVRNHLMAAYRKLHARNNIEAFHEMDWLRLPDLEEEAE